MINTVESLPGRLATGDRVFPQTVLWSVSGDVARVVSVGVTGVRAMIRPSIRISRIDPSGFIPALACGHCDSEAVMIAKPVREAGTEARQYQRVYCGPCARQYREPGEVQPIGRLDRQRLVAESLNV